MGLRDYDREVKHNQEMSKAHDSKYNYHNPLWANPLEKVGEKEKQNDGKTKNN